LKALGGANAMFGWFGRRAKISDGIIQSKKASVAENERPARDATQNAAILQAPLDNDLYGLALKAKGTISLKAVDDEYERLVWQKLRSDNSHRAVSDGAIIKDISRNEQWQNESEVSVKFSSWNVVRGELIRVFAFKNLSGPGTGSKIELRCRLLVDENKVRPFVHLLVKPRFSEQSKSVASVFAPSDDLDAYKVLVARVETADVGVNFVTFDTEDGELLVDVLKLGREVTIKLAESYSNRLRYVIPPLVLPNDATFSDRYDFFQRHQAIEGSI
jgi:hypothetical protein